MSTEPISARPIVIGILHPPAWYGDRGAFDAQIDALGKLDERIEVVVETYLGPMSRRSQQMDEPADPPPLTAQQLAEFDRLDVALTLELPPDIAAVAPNLRWVQAVGAGVDHLVPIVAGTDIRLTTNGGSNAVGIAEFVLARILGHYKPLFDIEALQAERRWEARFGRQLVGDTVALLGFGPINQAVAARLQAFGMRVLVVRRNPGPAPDGVELVVGGDRLHEALRQADVVVAAVPDAPDTVGMIGAPEFAAMRPGAFFCNVGRGSLVDEPALIAALESGHLGSAAIDVAGVEPLPSDNPLWAAPRLHISAHCSSVPSAMFPEVHRLFRANVQRFLAGEPLASEVDVARG